MDRLFDCALDVADIALLAQDPERRACNMQLLSNAFPSLIDLVDSVDTQSRK